jgi:hypothetical protein
MLTSPRFTKMRAAATAKRWIVVRVLAGHVRHPVQETPLGPLRRKPGA